MHQSYRLSEGLRAACAGSFGRRFMCVSSQPGGLECCGLLMRAGPRPHLQPAAPPGGIGQ